MLSLLIDHDFNNHILRGLIRRIPNLDAVTAREVDLSQAEDADLLAWAAGVGRVIVTHDRKTMPNHAVRRMRRDERISGLIIAAQSLPILDVINDLEIIAMCSSASEWKNVIRHLPL